jgi:hypothetical protein
VLGCILEHTVSSPTVRGTVDWQGLETTPTQGEDQGIVALEDLLMPAVTLDTDLNISETVLGRSESSDDDGVTRAELGRKLVRNVL